MDNCPYSGEPVQECSAYEYGEAHTQFHLDEAVSRGELARLPDGTYSLPEHVN